MITLQGIDPKMIANNLTPSNPIHQADNEASCYQSFLSRKGHANILLRM